MDLHATLMPLPLAVAGLLLLALALLPALRGIGAEPGLRGHRFPAALVAVLVLWQLRATTVDGPALHLLGAALLQLLFGWRLALAGILAVLAAHTANGGAGWLAFGVNGLVAGVLPVAVSALVTRAVVRRMPGNPFAYILIAGFAGGGLAMACVMAASTGLLTLVSTLDASRVLAHYTMPGAMLVFPEAFITGAAVAWLAMFYPAAVATWRAPWDGQRGY